jgi:hypothetical protein
MIDFTVNGSIRCRLDMSRKHPRTHHTGQRASTPGIGRVISLQAVELPYLFTFSFVCTGMILVRRDVLL